MTTSAQRRLPTTPPLRAVRPKAPRRSRRPAREQQVRLTQADLDLLGRLVRYHAVTERVLEHTVYAGKNRQGIYRRLGRLVRIGLLEDLRTGDSNRARPLDVFAMYVPTPEAYYLVGSELKPRSVNVHEVRHTLAIAEIGLAAERMGYSVLTDREIKRAISKWKGSRQATPPVAAPWLLAAGGRTHAPDLVVLTPNGTPTLTPSTAIEVELTAKSDSALRSVLTVYASSLTFTHVIYYVPDATAEARFKRVAASVPFTPSRVPVVRRYIPRHSGD